MSTGNRPVEMKEHESRSAEEVLAEFAWVRRLSRRLCLDAASADDLTQEVLLAGIVQPPRGGIPVRRWLAGIARNKARMASRGAARRAYHERSVTEPDVKPGTPELLERLEEHRRVADAVRGLKEPYRTTLLQRYVEDLTPTQIAARTGEPVSSVKTRLSRGLALLREELESSGGRHWYAALLPLARSEAAGPSSSLPALLGATMTAKHGFVLLALVLVLGALAGYFTWSPLEPDARPMPRDVTVAVETASAPATDLESLSGIDAPELLPEPSSRSIATATEPPLLAKESEQLMAAPEAPALARVRATVLTPFGEPLAGALIQQISLGGLLEALPGSDKPPALVHELGRTGPDGALVIDIVQPRIRSQLGVGSVGHETVIHGVLPEFIRDEHDIVIIAGPVRVIDGVVTDEEGLPLENAMVSLLCFEDFSERIGLPVPQHTDHLRDVTSDSEGRFRFPSAPEAPLTYVRVDAFGHEYDLVSAPDHGDASVAISLTRTRQGETALRGHVVCTNGSSSLGALVALPIAGESMRVASEDGLFEVPLSAHERGKMVIHATLPGFLPAVYERQPGEPWPDDLVLEFGEPALAIRGTVVDQDGRPLAGIQVGVADGTSFGLVFDPGGTSLRMQLLEDLAAPSGTATCITTKDGAFQIDGLLVRPYALLVQEPGTLKRMRSQLIEAGQSGVQLVFDLSEQAGPVVGRVTDREGLPIAGVQVDLSRSYPKGGSSQAAAKRVSRPTARTDADGRFRIKECAYADAILRCSGEIQFEVLDLPLSKLGDPLRLEIVLARNSPFRIEWSAGVPPESADSMRLEAKETGVAMLFRDSVEGINSVGTLSIGSPATPVHYVREGTYDVVLLSEDSEVERFPVEIRGADLQLIVH